MKVAEIRSRFIEYFKKHDHTFVESAPLVPQNDPTVMFTVAGMVPFKDVFTGREKRPYTRAVTVQKVLRAGGKHNDLENVGFTARHHTFFEMLGNFSFGDYFKKEAIRLAWGFVTDELGLSRDKLYITIYKDDDEAFELWQSEVGIPKEKIYRMGEEDNFWSMGETGPCGPCSEIFVDRGEAYSCGKPDCDVGCECDRYLEFWNLVFMQYNRDEEGNLTPLPKPSVDTGAGLERIAAILQGVDSNYEIDVFRAITDKISELVGKPYQPSSREAFAFRVIADHARATTFLIGDGVMPANEGRGYVLRRIIRRAIRFGRNLGFEAPFLHKVCSFVIDQMKESYPELADKKAFIAKATLAEEEQFFKTLERGLSLLDEEIEKAKKKGILDGEVAFKLYDTFGFPVDLTRIICREQDLDVDEKGFEACMERQREQSRKGWKGSGEAAVATIYHDIAEKLKEAGRVPEFVGYDRLAAESSCLAILIKEGEVQRSVDFYKAGGESEPPTIEAVFANTPFYAESGGQVGDRGRVSGHGFEGDVVDVQQPVDDLIVVSLKPRNGELKVGTSYLQETDRELRRLTARNHTATHLLHWALRETLGDHVKQAGSLVAPDLLRFDFSHFQALTQDEVEALENKINEKIWSASEVVNKEMGKDEAIEAGAIAFFGEKYGDRVRVVKVGDFSTELCGGTHVENASDIHLFKIASEASIAAGVRRIVAYTSKGAYQYLRERDKEVQAVRDRLKAANLEDVEARLDKMSATEKELKREIAHLKADAASRNVDQMLHQAKSINGTSLVTGLCETDPEGVKRLRELSDRIQQKDQNVVVVLGMKQPEKGKAFLLAAVGKGAPKGVKANAIIQELAPIIDGRGGGKPDMAQAGGANQEAINKALSEAERVVSGSLENG